EPPPLPQAGSLSDRVSNRLAPAIWPIGRWVFYPLALLEISALLWTMTHRTSAPVQSSGRGVLGSYSARMAHAGSTAIARKARAMAPSAVSSAHSRMAAGFVALSVGSTPARSV